MFMNLVPLFTSFALVSFARCQKDFDYVIVGGVSGGLPSIKSFAKTAIGYMRTDRSQSLVRKSKRHCSRDRGRDATREQPKRH